VLKREQRNNYEPLYHVTRDIVPKNRLSSWNKQKKWEYGYNKEFDIIIISKDGTIGDIYLIEGLRIALPSTPKKIDSDHNKWVPHEYPEELRKIRSKAQWRQKPPEFREKYVEYIEREFERREYGHWFMNNGKPTYLTGHNYMYLQHSKIDVGLPDFREANRALFLHWEACKADSRSYGQIYVKIRRSGFSFMSSSVGNDIATLAKDSLIGMVSKTGKDAKKMFTSKVVPMYRNYPFFFKPIRDGQDVPKTELSFRLPAQRITRKNMHDFGSEDEDEGLDTTIDWRNTDDNAYDSEKLLFLIEDEAGKIERPNNVLEGWRVRKTCLRVGMNVIGKCMMGSTVNPLAKGGDNFKKMYEDSDPERRSANGQTKSGLYRLFVPAEWNYEGFIDEYGWPVFDTPEEPVMGVDGRLIEMGVIDYLNNEYEARKHDPDDLNEFLRQNPRTISHAFRDESKESIFDLTKIYDQIEYNDSLVKKHVLTRGRFDWRNGEKYTEVIWTPDRNGRFLIAWHPPEGMRNNVIKKGGAFYPGNSEIGAFGCDPYDISGVVYGSGSKGALHGVTTTNFAENVPSNFFFLEYVARPKTAEMFFEDIIKACHYYGMPILVESNKNRMLYYMRNNGYRAFSLDRPDRPKNKLSSGEKEIGGVPMQGESIRQAHADEIDTYIQQYVGYDVSGEYRPPDEIGDMLFTRTLQDWANFDYNDRTKYDATISSGLALMAIAKYKYTPKKENSRISFNFVKYSQKGNQSEIR
jgi:hypothetical protein